MSNELVAKDFDFGESLISGLETTVSSYCSMEATTPEEKVKLYNAMAFPDKRLGDCINEVIKVKDVYCEIVNVTNKETGEVGQAPRVVLIDDKNVSYECVSFGIYGAVRKMMMQNAFGAPTWDPAIPIKIVQITKGEKKILSIRAQ